MTTIVAAIASSLITGGLALIGVVLSNRSSQIKMNAELEKQQAVFSTKLEALTAEVREHNNFAKRMPVVEEKIRMLEGRNAS